MDYRKEIENLFETCCADSVLRKRIKPNLKLIHINSPINDEEWVEAIKDWMIKTEHPLSRLDFSSRDRPVGFMSIIEDLIEDKDLPSLFKHLKKFVSDLRTANNSKND